MKQVAERPAQWAVACDVKDLDGEALLECTVAGHEILLVRAEDRIVACPAVCPHMEERLVDGFCDGHLLTCSKHLWQWDLTTGEPVGLAEQPLTLAPARIEHGIVYVDMTRLRS